MKGSATSETVSHYRILKKLGAGGMGEVYLAEDTRLNRKVAIKFLSSESVADERARKRLIREAQTAAKLDHPNICAIHEVAEEDGRSFIVMQYIEGETLANRLHGKQLELREALEIAVQTADALAEAHSRGIIHRDIKPQNILITPHGQVKVVDFGLAKIAREKVINNSEAATESLFTGPGIVVGTVQYMSPEQVKGEALDARSDTFSFGVVLYEMISGHHPFAAESFAVTFSKILTSEPLPIGNSADAPPELQRIVRKCLAKDKEQRYQSVRDLLIDLHNLKRDSETGSHTVARAKLLTESRTNLYRIAAVVVGILALSGVGIYLLTGRGKAIDSLAVLPFVNVSNDPETEYLSDGITESLINSFSRLRNLKVMSRDSVFRYKGQAKTAQAVGRDLKVQAVLTGRVTQRGDDLMISTELLDVRDNSQIWGEQYNRKLADILTVQSEIANEISEKLRLRLSGEEQKVLSKRYTENPEAYRLYLLGRFFWSKRSAEGLKRGREYFQQAINLDPTYAPAYAGVADATVTLGSFLMGVTPPREAWAGAESAARQALKLDDTLAEAHSSLGFLTTNYAWNWPEAEKEFKRAIELKPDYANARHFYAHYLIYMGRKEEALAASQSALELEPLDVTLNAHLGWHYLYARQYDQAVDQLAKTIEMNQDFAMARWFLAMTYEQKAMFAEAIGEFQKAVTLSKRNPTILASLGYAYARAGQAAEARKLLEELHELSKQRYVLPYCFAVIHTGLGEKDQAFVYLEKSYEERDSWMSHLKVEPRLDGLRSDLRFADLMRRVGLPQ